MSDIKAELILEVWDHIKDFIPVKERQAIAYSFVEKFEEYGFDVDNLANIEGEDKYLDKVFSEKANSYSNDFDDDE